MVIDNDDGKFYDGKGVVDDGLKGLMKKSAAKLNPQNNNNETFYDRMDIIDKGLSHLTEGSMKANTKKMTQQQKQQNDVDRFAPPLPVLGIYRMEDDVLELEKATEQSSCYDLRAYIPQGSSVKVWNLNNKKRDVYSKMTSHLETTAIVLEPQDRALIPTGIQMDIPKGYSFRIHPRSGESLKRGIKLNNSEGVIDSDYINPVYISLYNTSGARVYIEHQSRVAQGELQLDTQNTIRRMRKPPKQKTSRSGGLGHTGNK